MQSDFRQGCHSAQCFNVQVVLLCHARRYRLVSRSIFLSPGFHEPNQIASLTNLAHDASFQDCICVVDHSASACSKLHVAFFLYLQVAIMALLFQPGEPKGRYRSNSLGRLPKEARLDARVVRLPASLKYGCHELPKFVLQHTISQFRNHTTSATSLLTQEKH